MVKTKERRHKLEVIGDITANTKEIQTTIMDHCETYNPTNWKMKKKWLTF
jgi:hypothetical protein